MDAAAIDADPMLRLLTDALRRGPGSPEWHKAVSDLRDTDTPAADEYRLLIAARERLESGRAYREVRAGPGFTRELFGKLDETPRTSTKLPLGLGIRLALLLALVTAIALLIVWVSQSRSRAADALADRLFVTPVHDWSFANGVPRGLQVQGDLKVTTQRGDLRPALSDKPLPAGCSLALSDGQSLTRGVCLECRIDYEPGPTKLLLSLSNRSEAAESETGGVVVIACDSTGVAVTNATAAESRRSLTPGPHVLRLKAAGGVAVADVDGQVLWSGASPGGDTGYVRLALQRTAPGGATSGVQSLRVLAP